MSIHEQSGLSFLGLVIQSTGLGELVNRRASEQESIYSPDSLKEARAKPPAPFHRDSTSLLH